MVGVTLIVNLAYNLMIVVPINAAERNSAAGIIGLGKLVRYCDRSFAEQRRIDLIVNKRCRQCDGTAAITSWRSEISEIAGQHFRAGYERYIVRRSLADGSSLIAAEEENLVRLDRTANGSTELI